MKSGKPQNVSLLSDAAKAAEHLRRLEARQHEEREAARDELRVRIRTAHDEGIPFAAIARTIGLSRERVRQLYQGL